MGRKVLKGGSYKPTVQISREAKDALTDWLEKNDRPEQGAIVGKIIKWFVRQPPAITDVVLGRIPEPEPQQDAPLNDIGIVLAPEQFMKKKGKRTG